MKQKLQFLIYLALIVIPIASLAQESKIDSLQKMLKANLKDTSRVNTLLNIAITYINMERKEAKEYAEKALDLAQKVGFSKGEADALLFLGVCYHNEGKLKEAIFFYRKATVIAEKAKYDSCIERCYQYLSMYYHTTGNYNKALEGYLKSLSIAEKCKDKATTVAERQRFEYSITDIANNIGLIYHNQKDFDKSFQFLEKALTLAKKNKIDAQIAKVLGNISGVYSEQAKYTNALEYAQNAYSIAQKTLDTNLIYDTQNEVAKAYAGLGQVQKGIDLLQESLTYFQKSGDVFNNIYCQIELCRLYIKTKQFDKAKNALENALKTTEKDKPQDQIRAIYEEYTELYKAKGDYKLAFEYMEKHNVLKDSIFGIRKIREITEIEDLYKNEQLELQKQQNSALKAESQAKNLWIAVLGLGLFLILLVAVLVIRNRQHKLNMAQQAIKNIQDNIHSIEQQLEKAEEDKVGNEAQIIQLKKMLEDKRAEIWKELEGKKYPSRNEALLEQYIRLTNHDFIEKRKASYPNIKSEDLYLLFFKEQGMSNQRIAEIFSTTEGAIKTRWYRLNEKYSIDNE